LASAVILAGAQLFKLSCESVKAGLRIDHPDADESQIHELMLERIYRQRDLRPS
jgi:hypothetical protein